MLASWLWASADVRRRWPSLVVLAVLVAIPVGAVLALVAGARRADTSVDRFAEVTQLADVVVFTEADPQPLIDELRADQRVSSIEQSRTVGAVAEPMEFGQFGFSLIGADDTSPGGLGRPLLIAGRYPRAGSTDEILVNERSAQAFGFEVGQRVTISGVAETVSFETFQLGQAEIVGIVRLSLDLVDDPSSEAFAIAGPSFLDGRWREAAAIGSILWVRLNDRGDDPTVISELSQRVVRGDVLSTAGLLGSAQRAADLQHRGLLVAAAVVGITGLVAVAQGIGRHLAPRREDSDALAAMGLTPKERSRAALLSVAPALLGGALLGVAVAVACSPLLPFGLARRADPDVGLHADWRVLSVGSVVAICSCAVVTIVASRRLGRAGRRNAGTRASLMARLSERWGLRPVPSAGTQLAMSSGYGRARLPVVPTLLVLVATAATATAALVVRSSLDGLAAAPERFGQPWALLVANREGAIELTADPRVAGVEIAHTGEINVVGDDGLVRQIATVGIAGAGGPAWLAVLDGRAPGGPGEIAVGTTTMRNLGLSIGDSTTVSGPCGERGARVVGRAIVPLFISDDPDEGSVVPLATFDDLCADQLTAEIDENEGLAVRLRDPDDAAALIEEQMAAERFAQPLGATPSSVTTLAELRDVPVIVVATIGLLGLFAAGHALLLAVRRRQRDLAVLRALGMRPGDIGRVVGWQAVTMTIVAVVIGIPAGLVLGRLVWTAIAQSSNVIVRIDVEPLQLVAVGGVTLVVLIALAIWPSRRAARLKTSDVLRTE
ncbi:MAG: FtsX-like permease family protein [Ilumatobacteraceae bacterium]